MNNRLHGDATEDPNHPKVQFPTEEACPDCRIEGSPGGLYDNDTTWHTGKVIGYLTHFYDPLNIVDDSSGEGFSETAVQYHEQPTIEHNNIQWLGGEVTTQMPTFGSETEAIDETQHKEHLMEKTVEKEADTITAGEEVTQTENDDVSTMKELAQSTMEPMEEISQTSDSNATNAEEIERVKTDAKEKELVGTKKTTIKVESKDEEVTQTPEGKVRERKRQRARNKERRNKAKEERKKQRQQKKRERAMKRKRKNKGKGRGKNRREQNHHQKQQKPENSNQRNRKERVVHREQPVTTTQVSVKLDDKQALGEVGAESHRSKEEPYEAENNRQHTTQFGSYSEGGSNLLRQNNSESYRRQANTYPNRRHSSHYRNQDYSDPNQRQDPYVKQDNLDPYRRQETSRQDYSYTGQYPARRQENSNTNPVDRWYSKYMRGYAGIEEQSQNPTSQDSISTSRGGQGTSFGQSGNNKSRVPVHSKYGFFSTGLSYPFVTMTTWLFPSVSGC